VSPHGRKDVVKLDVDGGERQESGDEDLEWTSSVPWNLGWDLPSHLGCSGRSAEVFAGVVLGYNSAKHSQRECQQREQRRDGEDCREWKSAGRTVRHGQRIDPHEHQYDWGWEEPGSDEDALHPVLALHLAVHSHSRVTCDD